MVFIISPLQTIKYHWYFKKTYLFILMSSGPLCLSAKPLFRSPNCIEDTPTSNSTPSAKWVLSLPSTDKISGKSVNLQLLSCILSLDKILNKPVIYYGRLCLRDWQCCTMAGHHHDYWKYIMINMRIIASQLISIYNTSSTTWIHSNPISDI